MHSESFQGQKLLADSIDMAYGVNSLHVAKNISFTLKEIHNVLKPGGVLVMSESIRSKESHLLVQEVIFNLLGEFSSAKEIRGNIKRRGFLFCEDWVLLAEEAGFKDVEYLLNTGNSREEKKISSHPALAMVMKCVKK